MLTDDEELDPLIFDNLEVNRRAEVAHIDPASSPLNRGAVSSEEKQIVTLSLNIDAASPHLNILLLSHER